MAEYNVQFDLSCNGTLTFAGTEAWVDLLSTTPNPNSPIPAGKRAWVAYITCISYDKNATFELRPNLPTKSLGNATDTQLRGMAVVALGESAELDVYYGGVIQNLSPVTADSTGVEKLWMRIKSGSGNSGTYEWIVYYTLI